MFLDKAMFAVGKFEAEVPKSAKVKASRITLTDRESQIAYEIISHALANTRKLGSERPIEITHTPDRGTMLEVRDYGAAMDVQGIYSNPDRLHEGIIVPLLIPDMSYIPLEIITMDGKVRTLWRLIYSFSDDKIAVEKMHEQPCSETGNIVRVVWLKNIFDKYTSRSDALETLIVGNLGANSRLPFYYNGKLFEPNKRRVCIGTFEDTDGYSYQLVWNPQSWREEGVFLCFERNRLRSQVDGVIVGDWAYYTSGTFTSGKRGYMEEHETLAVLGIGEVEQQYVGFISKLPWKGGTKPFEHENERIRKAKMQAALFTMSDREIMRDFLAFTQKTGDVFSESGGVDDEMICSWLATHRDLGGAVSSEGNYLASIVRRLDEDTKCFSGMIRFDKDNSFLAYRASDEKMRYADSHLMKKSNVRSLKGHKVDAECALGWVKAHDGILWDRGTPIHNYVIVADDWDSFIDTVYYRKSKGLVPDAHQQSSHRFYWWVKTENADVFNSSILKDTDSSGLSLKVYDVSGS